MNGTRAALTGLCVLLLSACTNHLVDQVPANANMRNQAAQLPLRLLAKGAVAAEKAYHGMGGVQYAYSATHDVTFLPEDEATNPKIYNALFLAVPKKACVPLSDPAVRNGDVSGVQILSFRGTADVNDLFVDVTPGDVLVPNTALRLHPGFLAGAEQGLKDLGDSLIQRTKGGCPLLVVGHSKGGATALAAFLLLAEVHHVPPENMLVVTIGQPLVSFPVEARLSQRVVRIIHAMDAVPTVPPATRNRYRHVGMAIYLWDDPDAWSLLTREQAEGEWWDAEKVAYLFNKARTNNFHDHSAEAYRDRTAALTLDTLAPYDRAKRWPK